MWHNVKDMLPPEGHDVLVRYYDGVMKVASYIPPKWANKHVQYCSGWYPGGTPLVNAPHWRELPKYP